MLFGLFRPKNTEATSAKVAKLASRGWRHGKAAVTDAEFRSICASAMTQTPDRAPKG